MINSSISNQENLYQNASLQKQISDLEERYSDTLSKINEIGITVGTIQTSSVESGMVNLVNNGDFAFNDTGYNDATYTDSDDYAADWYVKAQGTADWLVSTLPGGAVSAQALKADVALNSYWNKAAGITQIGGGDILGQKMAKKYFTGGNRAFVRMQMHKDVGATVDDAISLKVSLYDNTTGQKKILEGQTLQVSPSTQGATGSFTRKYILQIITATGSFYSDVITIPEVTNALSVTDTSNLTANYVQVSWDAVLEEQEYRLYRHDSEYNEWRLIAQIRNGSTSFRDNGGRNGAIFTPPASQINPKAVSVISNVGAGLLETPRDVLMSVRIPSTYDFSVTTEQWLQIEFVKPDGSATTNTEISARGIVIDKIGLSLANGKWLPSAKDQQTAADIQTTTPPVSSGGGDGGGYIPPDGGGGFGCVLPTALIYTVNDVTGEPELVSADKVYVGMLLIGKNSTGDVKASKVKSIFKGETGLIYNVITRDFGFVLPCSPTHPIIQTVKDRNGVAIHKIERAVNTGMLDVPILVCPDGTAFAQDYILAIEKIYKKEKVLTFEMEDETMTFISNRIVSHNLARKDEGTTTF